MRIEAWAAGREARMLPLSPASPPPLFYKLVNGLQLISFVVLTRTKPQTGSRGIKRSYVNLLICG